MMMFNYLDPFDYPIVHIHVEEISMFLEKIFTSEWMKKSLTFAIPQCSVFITFEEDQTARLLHKDFLKNVHRKI